MIVAGRSASRIGGAGGRAPGDLLALLHKDRVGAPAANGFELRQQHRAGERQDVIAFGGAELVEQPDAVAFAALEN